MAIARKIHFDSFEKMCMYCADNVPKGYIKTVPNHRKKTFTHHLMSGGKEVGSTSPYDADYYEVLAGDNLEEVYHKQDTWESLIELISEIAQHCPKHTTAEAVRRLLDDRIREWCIPTEQ